MLANSTYGRSKTGETHAEGFAYWLLTPENERTKAWELWNEFFLEHLSNLRKTTDGFYYYSDIDTLM